MSAKRNYYATNESAYSHAREQYRKAYRAARRNKVYSSDGMEYWRSIVRQYRVILNNAKSN
jgi:hypothetical protein